MHQIIIRAFRRHVHPYALVRETVWVFDMTLLNVRLMGFFFFGNFWRHNSSLVCMAWITYVYIDTIFMFYRNFFCYIYTHLYCLVRCLSMIVWTHAVLGVLYVCVLYFCICTCSAQLSMFPLERCSRNMLLSLLLQQQKHHREPVSEWHTKGKKEAIQHAEYPGVPALVLLVHQRVNCIEP